MQSLPLLAICAAVTAAALAALGGIVAHIYGKASENARRKEMENEYLRVRKILKTSSEVGNVVMSLHCREWLRDYGRGRYAPFPHPEPELLPGGKGSPRNPR